MLFRSKMFDYYDRIAIDEFLDVHIYNNFQSFSSVLPICCQMNNYSDVSDFFYNNFYTQTYNWNVYCPKKLPQNYTDQDYVLSIRNEHLNYKNFI